MLKFCEREPCFLYNWSHPFFNQISYPIGLETVSDGAEQPNIRLTAQGWLASVVYILNCLLTHLLTFLLLLLKSLLSFLRIHFFTPVA